MSVLSRTPCPPELARTLGQYVENWVHHLSERDWDGAMALIQVPNHYGVRWSVADVRRALTDYGKGVEPKVSRPEEVEGESRVAIYALQGGAGYAVDYDVPLDGGWRDLTAQFWFLREGGRPSRHPSRHARHVVTRQPYKVFLSLRLTSHAIHGNCISER